MTYTLAKMSGKAVRLAARLLAVVKLGGKLDDTPDKFYDRAMEESGLSRIELERKFGIATDKFEERIRDEEGFIGDNLAVFDQVRKKLGEGFYLQSEVAHDHHINGDGDESRKAKKTRIPEADKGNVKKLLKRLRNTTDKTEARKLRRQLRRLGHRGGKGGK